jgi:hypothetical protein
MRLCVAAVALGVVAATSGSVAAAAPAAHADGPCLFQGDWNCYGTPRYNGPLQNTWSHGLTTMPQICPGGASMQPCQFYVPQP